MSAYGPRRSGPPDILRGAVAAASRAQPPGYGTHHHHDTSGWPPAQSGAGRGVCWRWGKRAGRLLPRAGEPGGQIWLPTACTAGELQTLPGCPLVILQIAAVMWLAAPRTACATWLLGFRRSWATCAHVSA